MSSEMPSSNDIALLEEVLGQKFHPLSARREGCRILSTGPVTIEIDPINNAAQLYTISNSGEVPKGELGRIALVNPTITSNPDGIEVEGMILGTEKRGGFIKSSNGEVSIRVRED